MIELTVVTLYTARISEFFILWRGCFSVFCGGSWLCSVAYKLLFKITAGLFVDLADLLPDKIQAQEIKAHVFLEGKLVVSGSKKRVVEIADMVTWTEAFTIFCMILCHTFPSRWKGLNQ